MFAFLRQALITVILTLVMIASAWALTLQEAAERVARQHDAKVVSARTIERDGRRIHVIRTLTRNGVVRTLRVPAEND